MWLEALFADLPVQWRGPHPGGRHITEITLDLDEVGPGVLFIARPEWYGDTHTRLGEALQRGAAALAVSDPTHLPATCPVPVAILPAPDPLLAQISARFYGHPSAQLTLLGVTGTNGKTSTVLIAEHLLRALGQRPARLSTVGYRFEQTQIAASNTTPDALVIQRFAHDAHQLGARSLVLEASSHGLALQRLAELRFDAVGFTQIGHDHLDFHQSVERYRAAKALLFTQHLEHALSVGKRPAAVAWVGPLSPKEAPQSDAGEAEDLGAALLHASPAAALRVAVGHPHSLARLDLPAGCLTLSVRSEALPHLRGQRCWFRWAQGEEHSVDLPLVGAHNVQNAAVALGMVVAADPDRWPQALAALHSAPPAPGRLERMAERVFVDYAHTPDAVQRILRTLRATTEGPIHVVLGCGGDRDARKRAPMGRAALEADRAWFTADNPRSEAVEAILEAMCTDLSAAERARVRLQPDRYTALAEALHESAHALLVVLGRGHEPAQVIAGRRYAFDDRQELRRLTRAQAEGLPPDLAPLRWIFGPEDALTPDARLAWLLARPHAPTLLDGAIPEPSAQILIGTRAELVQQLTPQHRAIYPLDGPPLAPAALEAPRLPSLRSRRP